MHRALCIMIHVVSMMKGTVLLLTMNYRTPPSKGSCGHESEEESLIVEGDVPIPQTLFRLDFYEGLNLFRTTSTPKGNTSASSINAIILIVDSPYSAVNKRVGFTLVTVGHVYRSDTGPCMYRRY